MATHRRRWLFPNPTGHLEDIDLALLDPDDEDDRRLLIQAEHPELADALEDGVEEVDNHGQPMSPHLHLAMHELVANQLWHDDPPEVWATVERLTEAGYERHEVLHMVGGPAAEELWHMTTEGRPFDRERHRAALAALPGSWEDERAAMALAQAWEGVRPPDGTTFTHRLTDAEVAGGYVVYTPDLEVLAPMLADHGHLHLTGAATAELDHDESGAMVLRGPGGWFGEASSGDLLGFRLVGDEVEVVPVAALPAVEGLGERLAAAFHQQNDGDGLPVPVSELIGAALVGPGRAAVAPPAAVVLPPVGELLAGHGFELRAGHAAPAGTDWERFGRIRAAAMVALTHGLDPEGAHALLSLAEMYRLFTTGKLDLDGLGEDGLDDGLSGELAGLIGDEDLGPAFADLTGEVAGPEELARFADALLAGAGGRHRVGPAWLSSVAAIRSGDHERAETMLRRALDCDAEHRPSLEDAAWIASDRGDARRAVALLERLAELGDDEAGERAELLLRYTCAPRALARRNDPCPCGSGRKHKHCCLGTTGAVALPDRVRWIWEKLMWFLSRAGLDDEIDAVLDELGSDETGDELLAASLVLFQDGAVEDFLRLRGPMLPVDERLLVTQWGLVDRSVHEVVAVERGATLTVRDIRTGEVVEARERIGSTMLAVGDVLWAHVVPDGVGHQIVGGVVVVPLRLRDPLLSALDEGADAVDLAALLAAALTPPEISTTEGEAVVLCEARYRIPAAAAAAAAAALDALDAVLVRQDDTTWSESVEVEGRTLVRGMVTIEGDEAVVSANSEVRFRRLKDTVERAVPGLVPVGETLTPVAEMLASGERPKPSAQAPLPPGAAEALAAFMRQQEDRWLDESVPALGGLTPRAAAADPTRREQLVALLHEFDQHSPPPGAATFDTGRLRGALGLE